MGPKSPKIPSTKTSTYAEAEEIITQRLVGLSLVLNGEAPGSGEWLFLVLYNGQIVLDGKWKAGADLETEALPLNLKEAYYQDLVTNFPLVFLLRTLSGKGSKDPDPLLHPDNRAGATVDLFPLIIGAEEVIASVRLVNIATGEPTDCVVAVEVRTSEPSLEEITIVPMMITLISGHCLPSVKEGTVYLGAIGLDGVVGPMDVNFGMSLSSAKAEKLVWASTSSCGYAANTAINVPREDKFIPDDLTLKDTDECKSCYWNAMKRVRVDANLLRERLMAPFVFEVAGVPKLGKIEVRGRYMAFVDARVLLQPGQYGVTICAKLLFYNEFGLPGNVGALLDLPTTSAKISARDTDFVLDEFGHNSYIAIRFDLWDPLVAKIKIAALYENIGLMAPEAPAGPIDELEMDLFCDDTCIDVRKIRKEGGALAVHKELSSLACRGVVPMNQGIKRTAANRLLMHVRAMLKQFPPGDCSYIEWQDTVTAQHAASRRAVTSSFAPQPPPFRAPARVAPSRSRMADDMRIADEHVEANFKYNPRNPRALLCKAIRCLEEGKDNDAKDFILEGLYNQPKCRYLLWLFGAQEFDDNIESANMAVAAFRIAVKGDYSDGTTNAIGWAAIHALRHYVGDPYASFVALRRMRKAYELPRQWIKFLDRWTEATGQEEIIWVPSVISDDSPMLLAAAFFLCLRCYKLSDRILECVENGCEARGNRFNIVMKPGPDVYYVRAASLALRNKLDEAMNVTREAIKKFGPTAIMAQMRATCIINSRSWDGQCQLVLEEADKAGALICPSLLLKAAMGGMNTNPEEALQRAARAHRISPSAHTALIIGRIYAKMKETCLAERWLAAAVKLEPLLADGWAMLGLIAMREKQLDKARTMLRTARQVGPVSADIGQQVKKVKEIVELEVLPESLVKHLCFCDYY